MDCVFGTIGILAVAITTLLACGVALTLALLPQAREHRRLQERAAFLRIQLLHHLDLLPPFLQERDRLMPIEHRDMLDEWCCFAQHASLLEMGEWTSVLQAQATLMTARNRSSFTKREARIAQQSIDHAAAVLRAYASDEGRRTFWWKKFHSSRNNHPTSLGSSINRSLKLRDTAG